MSAHGSFTVLTMLSVLIVLSPGVEAACDEVVMERNKEVIRLAFEEAWNAGNFENVAPAIATDGKFHIRGRTFPHGISSFRSIVAAWRQAFPDFEFIIEDMIAEGDTVAARLKFSGTHEGKWKEFEATGKRIDFTATMFFRFEGGNLVEIWEDFDEHGLRQQLQAAAER